MLQPVKILVVDDDPALTEVVRIVLDSRGYDVDIALNKNQALERIESGHPDLVILDIMMDRMTDGFEICHRIKSNRATKHILVLAVSSISEVTGLQFDTDPEGAYFSPDEFASKPIKTDVLLSRVETLLLRSNPDFKPPLKVGETDLVETKTDTPEEDPDIEALLTRAHKPTRQAMELHPFYQGKLEVTPKCRIKDFNDFAIWYTPGVAAPCLDIKNSPETVFKHTNKANFVAVVSDGTRVLGLGNIGPEAALPVMEGKAILFKYLGGVDAFPICLRTTDPDEIIQACKWLEPSFGGINLEDIEKPKCFYILDRLRKEMNIPVWHDDQQGTAAITLAGLINALKIVGKKREDVTIAMVGAGASNIAISRIMIAAGFPSENIIMVDSKGILNKDRDDIRESGEKEKWHMCEISNRAGRTGGISEALSGADVCIALSRPGPGVIKPEWVASMASDAIVFACANPVPEIWPWEAKKAGARIVATGRSDFPNQVNNSLGFPGIFRGALDVWAKTITDEMCIAASEELARCAEEKGISEDYILPGMDEWWIYPREAAAVGLKAIEQGLARKVLTEKEILDGATKKILRSIKATTTLMSKGLIKVEQEEPEQEEEALS